MLLRYLLDNCDADDKAVRFRCCQLVCEILLGLPDDMDMRCARIRRLGSTVPWAHPCPARLCGACACAFVKRGAV